MRVRLLLWAAMRGLFTSRLRPAMSSSLKRTPYARCLILKTSRDEDEYLARTLWGDVEWQGTRAEAEALGVDAGRLERADATGSSSRTGAFGWEDR